MKKNILLISHNYWPTLGGAELLFQSLAQNLASKYKVSVFTSDALNSEMYLSPHPTLHPLKNEKVNKISVTRETLLNPIQKLAIKLWPFLSKNNVNRYGPLLIGPHFPHLLIKILFKKIPWPQYIICGPFPTSVPFYGYLLKLITRSRLIIIPCIHTKDPFHTGSILTSIIRKADLIFALTREELDYFSQKNIDQKKIIEIGVGVDEKLLKAKKSKDKHQGYLLYLGQESPHKNVLLLLKSMLLLWKKGLETKLLIAGSRTSYSFKIDSFINNLPPIYQNMISRKNNFSTSEKPSLLDHSLFLVNPSSLESFGIVFIEAWSRKKAVIGANVSAVKKLISHQKDGLLFKDKNELDLAQKIEQLVKNPSQRRSLGQSGFNKVMKKYNWKEITDKIILHLS